mmetsp:Transcript_6708/g.13615  ORF Transcript_6708/g.13615 Transcript_6708/m.13615 type:complete len:129 (+) Transcript_6708:54-440(+)
MGNIYPPTGVRVLAPAFFDHQACPMRRHYWFLIKLQKTAIRAKDVYTSVSGYATNQKVSFIWRTATKILAAVLVLHVIIMIAATILTGRTGTIAAMMERKTIGINAYPRILVLLYKSIPLPLIKLKTK